METRMEYRIPYVDKEGRVQNFGERTDEMKKLENSEGATKSGTLSWQTIWHKTGIRTTRDPHDKYCGACEEKKQSKAASN